MEIRTIQVVHTAEVAHRLFLTPGKCARIHGHGLKIRLALTGEVDDHGLLAGIDFGTLKREFRAYIDKYLDHQVLLNKADPFAQPLFGDLEGRERVPCVLPGMRACEADPTTENLAKWIGEWARVALSAELVYRIDVQVDETPVNSGTWSGEMNHALYDTLCLTDILGRLVRSDTLHPVNR